MEVTFHPFDPDLAQQFAAAWRRHPGDVAAITADLHTAYPEASINAGAEEGWHVYREVADDGSEAAGGHGPVSARAEGGDGQPRARRPTTRR